MVFLPIGTVDGLLRGWSCLCLCRPPQLASSRNYDRELRPLVTRPTCQCTCSSWGSNNCLSLWQLSGDSCRSKIWGSRLFWTQNQSVTSTLWSRALLLLLSLLGQLLSSRGRANVALLSERLYKLGQHQHESERCNTLRLRSMLNGHPTWTFNSLSFS